MSSMPSFLSRDPSLRRLLALATLAVAGGAAAGNAMAGPGERGMRDAGSGAHGMSQRMLEQVGATAEQRAQIEQIMTAARADLRAQREEGRGLQQQMRALFTQPTIDEVAIEALRQQMVARHDAASQRMTQAMLESSRVLTVEQRQQIAALMAERAERHGRHDRRDRAMPGDREGRRQGG